MKKQNNHSFPISPKGRGLSKFFRLACVLTILFSPLFWREAGGEASAQNIGINSTGATPNASAMLDIASSSKGLLIPRVTLCQRTIGNCAGGLLDGSGNLVAAAQGLVVYQTDGSEGFYYNTSTTTTPSWVMLLSSSTSWLTTGNTGTTASTSAIGTAVNNNFIGTTDAKDFVFASNNLERLRVTSGGNVGIGTTTPLGPLHIYKSNSGGLGGNIILDNIGNAVGDQTAIIFSDGGNLPLYQRAEIRSTVEASPYYGNIAFFTGLGSMTERMRLTGAGNVGIGTTAPGAKLEVAGEIKLGNSATACSATNEGSQRYNSTSKIMEFCNGTSWVPVGNNVLAAETFSGTGNPGGLVGTTGGFVGFTTKQNSNAAVFQNNGTAGITILRAGKVMVSYTQDFSSASSYGYVSIILNGTTIIGRALAASSSGNWETILGIGAYSVSTNDIITFRLDMDGATFASLDPLDWSIMSITWIGTP